MNERPGESDLPRPGDDKAIDRLRSFGAAPVPPEVRSVHVQAMVAAASAVRTGARPRAKRFGRLAVAAAAFAGFLAGSTGLAMAGALPDRAQSAAADVLSVVGIDVPAGKEGKRGPCVSQAAKLEDVAAKQAAKDACPTGPFGVGHDGNPGRGHGSGNGGGSEDRPGRANSDDDPCTGRPAWAGNSDMTAEERAAAQAERDACIDTDADGGGDAGE